MALGGRSQVSVGEKRLRGANRVPVNYGLCDLGQGPHLPVPQPLQMMTATPRAEDKGYHEAHPIDTRGVALTVSLYKTFQDISSQPPIPHAPQPSEVNRSHMERSTVSQAYCTDISVPFYLPQPSLHLTLDSQVTCSSSRNVSLSEASSRKPSLTPPGRPGTSPHCPRNLLS